MSIHENKIAAVAAALVLASAGCVERTIEVRSDPSGARVYLDRAFRGRTPLSIPFHHYGSRHVAVELEGYRPQAEARALWPPWYEIFPLDFLSECLLPFTLYDRRMFAFRLKKKGEPFALEGRERRDLIERGNALREAHATD